VPDGVISVIAGLLIGAVTGVIQFFLLTKFVFAVTSGKFGNKTVLFAVTQFLFPFTILILYGFLFRESLMWAGIGMASALIISAVIKFVVFSGNKNSTDKSKKTGQKKKKKTGTAG